MNRRGFLAALAAVPTFAALPAWAARESIDRLLASKERIVWISGPERSGKTRMATELFIKLANSGAPTAVIGAAWGLGVQTAHPNGVRGMSLGALRRTCPRYVILDEPYFIPELRSEGDIVTLARQRTGTWADGKVFVFSEDNPPAHLRDVAHFRI